jgi:hypothetical protein
VKRTIDGATDPGGGLWKLESDRGAVRHSTGRRYARPRVAASAEGPIDEAPVRVLRADRVSEQRTSVQVHTGDDDPGICLAVKSWGVSPDEDDISEIACTDGSGTGPGGDGAGCYCSSTARPLSVAALLGLITLARRRRRGH